MTPPSNDIRALLAEDRWIRRLAARLVGDPGAADDLVQEAYLTALTSTESPRSARAWLGGVVRNLWRDRARSGARRARREHGAARAEELPSSAELAAEVELRRRVAEAVLALDEPLRRTVVLRFFQDRSLASIAAAEGASVSTVHERVQRALARLRGELDRAHGGRREAWSAVLLPLAGTAGGSTLGGIAMAGAAKFAAAVIVLGAGAAWWWYEQGRERTALEAAPAPTPEAGPRRVAELTREPSEREVLAPEVDSGARSAAAPAASASAPAAISGRVVDATGRGLGGARVAWQDHDDPEPATSRADGSFELALSGASPGQDSVLCSSPELVTLLFGQLVGDWTVVAAPRASFVGTVVDELGAPVAGAQLEFRLKETLFRAVGLHALGFEREQWRTRSDAAGRFALADVAGGPNVALAARAPGFVAAELALPPGGDTALTVTLQRNRRATELTGIVLAPSGAPFPGASVSAGKETVTSDAVGRFTLPWSGGTGRFIQVAGVWREEGAADGATLIALARGYLPAEEPLKERDLSVPFVLRLGSAPLTCSGKVVDASGEPLPGMVVWLRDPRVFSREGMPTADGGSIFRDRHVESLLCADASVAAVTEANGSFRIGCLTTRSYSLAALDPRTCSRAGPWTIEAGRDDLVLEFRLEPTARVAGRVVSARGRPRSGMSLVPARTGQYSLDEAPQLAGAEYRVTTDADGRFAFEALATTGTWLSLWGDYSFRSLELASFSDLGNLEIVAPELCEVQVELSDPSLADSLRVLDREGEFLDVTQVEGGEQGFMFTQAPGAKFVEGRSPLFLAAETAATLVLLRSEGDSSAEVLRLALELDPDRRTVLRP